jgi:hypothetical protein
MPLFSILTPTAPKPKNNAVTSVVIKAYVSSSGLPKSDSKCSIVKKRSTFASTRRQEERKKREGRECRKPDPIEEQNTKKR